MDEEVTNYVFERVYRVSSKFEGSELGLYIVDEAVKRIKGTISLSSEADVGTIFSTFLLDLRIKPKGVQLNCGAYTCTKPSISQAKTLTMEATIGIPLLPCLAQLC